MPEHTPQTAEIRRVYADYNATTPIRPEVKAAMIEDMDICII